MTKRSIAIISWIRDYLIITLICNGVEKSQDCLSIAEELLLNQSVQWDQRSIKWTFFHHRRDGRPFSQLRTEKSLESWVHEVGTSKCHIALCCLIC